ncbi:MAG: L-aspartate oxidase [Bacillota bacterium]|nr:L-aspartate oxidase [Bacillota bacterium]
MRTSRFISQLDRELPVVHTDFLIIGGGIAGLFTALKAVAYGKVTVLTKQTLKESNTGLAQGGIAAAVHEEDSPFLHLEDTLEAGAGLCDIDAVDVLVREGPDRVRELIHAGASFDMKDGDISLTREGAHSRARILHAADATGEAIRVALVAKCEENPDIHICEHHFLIDLLGDEQQRECYGALVFDEAMGGQVLYIARATILATGGAGQLYQFTTNPDVATADGMAAAFRIGCELNDLEFIQFHPTVLYSQDRQRFLISEAVRGEGGLLLNCRGERFMSQYHPLEELAPRDIVSRAILSELERTESECVYLDMRGIPSVTTRFPNIYRICLQRGIDLSKELVPVSPAAHYTMGGIKTNTSGETGISGLYACGETACTGVHGANRLASNSLLEGIVFGQRIINQVEEIMYRRLRSVDEIYRSYNNSSVFIPWDSQISPREAKESLQKLMWENVGIIRDEKGLKQANKEIEQLYNRLTPDDHFVAYLEVINMLTVAHIVVQAALWRKESRGGHFRSDFPRRNDIQWVKHMTFINC